MIGNKPQIERHKEIIREKQSLVRQLEERGSYSLAAVIKGEIFMAEYQIRTMESEDEARAEDRLKRELAQ